MKVTDFLVIIFVITYTSCQQIDTKDEELAFQQKTDSIASRQIDSAYKKITRDCDTALKYRLPAMVDSLLRFDTATLKKDTTNP